MKSAKSSSIRLAAIILAAVLLASLVSCETGPTVLRNTGPDIPENQLMIRVMIVPHGRHIKIFAETPFRLMSADESRRLLKDENYVVPRGAEITAIPEGIKIGRLKIIGDSCRLVPLGKAPIQVYEMEPRGYRGELIIYRNEIDMTVDVINEVGLEDYLAGVLGHEVSAAWQIEALKAQAVASRTRVLYQREFSRRNNERFDVRADIKDQVYGGVPTGPGGGKISGAVKGTAGEVLIFNGRIFKNYFSSTCGGATETVDRVFRDPHHHHPAGAIDCPYCKSSPVYRWRHRIKTAEVVRRIRNYTEEPFDTIVAIRAINLDAAGHGLRVEIVHNKGTIIFDNAYKFRTNILGRSINTEFRKDGRWQKALDAGPIHKEIIMSTSFEAKVLGDYIEFIGRGWGHGVGLCQFGAKYLAEHNYSYRRILSYYYPKALIAHNYNNQIK